MKKLLLIGLVLLAPLFCGSRIFHGPPVASSGSIYEFFEDFEGSNVTSTHSLVGTTKTGWVDATASQVVHGTPALFGNYSFYPTQPGTGMTHTFVTSAATVHLFAVCKIPTSIGNGDSFLQVKVGATTLGTVNWRTGNLARCVSGSTQGANTGAILVPGNTYYVWLDYTNGGSGANVTSAYISTTATKPGSATCTVTGGTSVLNADTFIVGSPTGIDGVYDNVIADGTKPIGSNPF